MKKITLFIIVAFLISFHAFSEIIRWKGMEMGLPQNPKWLQLYKASKNEKLLRKKFSIDKSERVVMGIASAPTLEEARAGSQLKAQAEAAKILSSRKVRLNFVYEFWEEDDTEGFSVYSLYTF